MLKILPPPVFLLSVAWLTIRHNAIRQARDRYPPYYFSNDLLERFIISVFVKNPRAGISSIENTPP